MKAARRRIDEARLALMLLTRLPVGRLRDPAPPLSAARWAFPLVGLLVGLVGWAVQAGALASGLGAAPGALLAIGAMAIVTGGLHLDGLADLADGLGGGRDRAHALDIMRDSRIGSYGTIALILAMGLSAGAVAGFDGGAPLPVFLLAGVASRLAMTATLQWLPAARADGLGKSAAGTGSGALVPGVLLCLGLVLVIGPAGMTALAVSIAVAGLVAWRAWLRLGGQTGDVLGAVQAAVETSCLLALSATLVD
jgi:adenosylcobinamide-GDP ribazoletransferase